MRMQSKHSEPRPARPREDIEAHGVQKSSPTQADAANHLRLLAVYSTAVKSASTDGVRETRATLCGICVDDHGLHLQAEARDANPHANTAPVRRVLDADALQNDFRSSRANAGARARARRLSGVNCAGHRRWLEGRIQFSSCTWNSELLCRADL